ncbi:Dyp-type peroxidase [Pseudomaricurvus alkylphenolicus]|uniref:Dyp-type peroxidase n=1 Tax=Pseudomaricurvus alkylphenolicus TaxID=1306991 RepID=UPI0014236330|nr:Dyp-type peroxidase [Pseudomaricurvus alkylphenolicus]NIB39057.1 Dyp-type peroxidase [Pseudomaricurvus alkylphenolicus]
MPSPQSGILAVVPQHACYLSFRRRRDQDLPLAQLRDILSRLIAEVDGSELVVGIGAPLATTLGADVPGLKSFPLFSAAGEALPSTQQDLWLWLRCGGPGDLLLRSHQLEGVLADGFELVSSVPAFMHGDSRDLSGYVDGTENPTGADALAAAILDQGQSGLLGSSFVAVQNWQHDFETLAGMAQNAKDDIIGRRLSDNVEFEGSPPSAHVKRTAQESFSPEAFVLRRSMPWSDGVDGGLHFVAFGRSFAPFEAQMNRMVGAEDGIKDGLFQISRPLSGEYYWCPPMLSGQLDLSLLGIG